MTLSKAMRRVLEVMAIAVGIVAVAAAIIGYFAFGLPGLWSGLIGGAMALVYSGATVVSIIVANRVSLNSFLAVILGFWLGKMVVFLLVIVLLRDQPFIVPIVLVGSMLVSAVITLVVDVLVVMRSRIPVVDDPAPTQSSSASSEK
ncbi:hypothetical protein [Humidisolicoccus flavus]|uniref:hypothetical protein n=1 Tax=Humidisolicoccus flavus TaxID=3111414 RepID=UPI00324D878D